MKRLSRTLIAVVAALGLLFVGTAVAQDDASDLGNLLPYYTQEECEANGGVWTWGFCVDPEKVIAGGGDPYAGYDPGTQTPATQAPATAVEAGSASASQPQYTG